MSDWKYGWRFLNAAGGTNPHSDREHYSVLPIPGEKWSDWTEHPNPAKPDGKDCGAGRLHVMLKPSAEYAPQNWWVWYVRWKEEDEVGRSNEKAGVTRYQLRRVRPVVLHRMIRLGWFLNLHGADLSNAYLRGANLSGANLSYANLYGANLSGADLRGANLSDANLRDAYLRDANLSNAYLCNANLSNAYLRNAYLRNADLNGAYLRYADLSGAYLCGARGLPDIGKENENG